LRPDQLAVDRTQSDTPYDFTHPRRLNLGASLVHGSVEGSEWRLSPYVRTEDVEQVRTLLYQTKDHPTEALTLGSELGWRFATIVAGKPATFSATAQVEESRLDSRYYDFADGARGALRTDGRSRRTTISGLAGGWLGIDARTFVRAGVRQDAVRVRSESRLEGVDAPARTFSLTSPFVALTREVSTPVTVYASYSAAFRVPTLNQLFDRRPIDTQFGPGYISNENLSPQKSHGVELGTRYDDARGGYALLSLYGIWVRDEIDFDVDRYANISRSWHRGAQLGLQQPIGSWLSGTLSYTYAPTTIRGGTNDGNQINGVPRHTAYGGLRFGASETWSLGGGVRYVGPQFLEKANLHELPDFGTVELSGSLKLARVRAAVRVTNLLDRDYADSGYFVDVGPLRDFLVPVPPFAQEERLFPASGRSFTLSLTAD
jgi:outer membrane receptor protein involved in Fe transport